MEQFLKEAQELQSKMVEWRRILHKSPEIGLVLPKTAEFVKAHLKEAGIEYQTYQNHSGITAVLGSGGKTIAIRADMDALPIKEETALPYASENENMHACGHDGHTSMLLATAMILKKHEKELAGRVKLIFQPAEEGPGGAEPMVKDGVMDGVDAILALHLGLLSHEEKNGRIGVSYSNTTAADDQVIITITGKGGHGSTPEVCVDPVAVGGLIINNLQYIVSREVSPHDAAVVTIASVKAGRGATNIIPETAELLGTIRNSSPSTRDYVLKRVEEIAAGTARMMRAECTVQFVDGYPALVNDRAVVESFLTSARKLVPEDEIQILEHGQMGGEDAAFFFEKAPGCYFLLGSYAPCPVDGKIYGAHHPRFCIDESVFYRGAALFSQAAYDWLKAPTV